MGRYVGLGQLKQVNVIGMDAGQKSVAQHEADRVAQDALDLGRGVAADDVVTQRADCALCRERDRVRGVDAVQVAELLGLKLAALAVDEAVGGGTHTTLREHSAPIWGGLVAG